MTTQYIPNSFQTPNQVIDELMFLLTDSEFRVLMFAIRHILGWKKKIGKRRAAMSISLFVNGFKYQDDNGAWHEYSGCGVKEGAVRQALASLEEFKVLRSFGGVNHDGREWELAFMTTDDVNLSALKERAREKGLKGKERMESARAKNPIVTPSVQQEGFCATEGQASCTTEGEGFCATGDNETHVKPNKKHNIADKPQTIKKSDADILATCFNVVPQTPKDWKFWGNIVKDLKAAGISSDMYPDYIQWIKKQSAAQGNWTVTPTSLTNASRPSLYISEKENKAKSPARSTNLAYDFTPDYRSEDEIRAAMERGES